MSFIRTASILDGERRLKTLPLIEGLTEKQCEYLHGAEVGDLVLVESVPKSGETAKSVEEGVAAPSWNSAHSGVIENGLVVEGEQAWGEGARAANDTEGQNDVEVGDAAMRDSNADDRLSDNAEQVENELESLYQTRADGGGQLSLEDPRTASLDSRSEHAGSEVDTSNTDESNDSELSSHADNSGVGSEKKTEATGPTTGLVWLQLTPHLEEYRFNKYGYDREGFNFEGYGHDGYDREGFDRNGFDREGYDQDGYDSAGYDRNDLDRDGHGLPSYDDTDQSEASEDHDSLSNEYDGSPQPVSQSTLFAVVEKLYDDNGRVVDFYLQRLAYSETIGRDDKTYQVYADEVVVDEHAYLLGTETESLANVIRATADMEHHIELGPAVSKVRDILLQSNHWQHSCNDGFLYTKSQLQEVFRSVPDDLSDFRPLCPVCCGKALVEEQLHLRALVEDEDLTDIFVATEHVNKRNDVLNGLGFIDPVYNQGGFDEKEWDLDWDDMRPDRDAMRDVGEEDDDIPWHLLPPEARDPNHDILDRPASEEVIASLPRKAFRNVVYQEDEPVCRVCSGDLEDETVMIQLPCEHSYCECLVDWLRHQHSCSNCRTVVSEVAAEEGQNDGQEVGGSEESTTLMPTENTAEVELSNTITSRPGQLDAYAAEVDSFDAQCGHIASVAVIDSGW